MKKKSLESLNDNINIYLTNQKLKRNKDNYFLIKVKI